MSSLTMAFIPGTRYTFACKMKSPYLFGRKIDPSKFADNATRTLTYLRDEMGAWRSTGERTIFHIFQWEGGALESFTDEQMRDYVVTKKIRTHPRSGKARPQSF